MPAQRLGRAGAFSGGKAVWPEPSRPPQADGFAPRAGVVEEAEPEVLDLPKGEKAQANGKATPQEAKDRLYEVIHTSCKVRAEPHLASRVLGVKKQGEKVTCNETTMDGWVHLKDDGGWMATNMRGVHGMWEVLRPAFPEQVELPVEQHGQQGVVCLEVIFRQAAVRMQPHGTARAKGLKKKGEYVFAHIQNFDGWVRLAGEDGWMQPMLGLAVRDPKQTRHVDLWALSDAWAAVRRKGSLSSTEVQALKELESKAVLMASMDFENHVQNGNAETLVEDGLLDADDLRHNKTWLRQRVFANTIKRLLREEPPLCNVVDDFALSARPPPLELFAGEEPDDADEEAELLAQLAEEAEAQATAGSPDAGRGARLSPPPSGVQQEADRGTHPSAPSRGAEAMRDAGKGVRSFNDVPRPRPPVRKGAGPRDVAGKAAGQWRKCHHCDLEGCDAEQMSAADLDAVRRRCEDKGYAGFAVRRGRAYLKQAPGLTKEDLEYDLNDPVIFHLYMAGTQVDADEVGVGDPGDGWEDMEGVDSVTMIEKDRKTYLLGPDNMLIDQDTREAIGIWNPETKMTESIEVAMIEVGGKECIVDLDGTLFDPLTLEAIGVLNPATQEIEPVEGDEVVLQEPGQPPEQDQTDVDAEENLDAAGWVERAWELQKQDYWYQAADAWTKALTSCESERAVELEFEIEILRGLGGCHRQLRDYEALLQDAERLLEYDATDREARAWKKFAEPRISC
mmetsp:Transcript_55014/g.141623  ORF Transcript_55014/g.141623 Transcript_55014/m.141623 type:complete len:735 (+) Transcript_55014:108-2312(+)